jgi:hypothetical protein
MHVKSVALRITCIWRVSPIFLLEFSWGKFKSLLRKHVYINAPIQVYSYGIRKHDSVGKRHVCRNGEYMGEGRNGETQTKTNRSTARSIENAKKE